MQSYTIHIWAENRITKRSVIIGNMMIQAQNSGKADQIAMMLFPEMNYSLEKAS